MSDTSGQPRSTPDAMGFGIEYSNALLSVGLLSEQQVRDVYLPLRFSVLHSEFGYDHGTVTDPAGFLDRYDRESIPFGVFKKPGTLIGAARLIVPSRPHDFPSYKFVSGALDRLSVRGLIGELSRALVGPGYRGQGLFQALFITALVLARNQGAHSLIVSEREDERFHDFLVSYHFSQIVSGYWFGDEVIAPTVKSASYLLDVRAVLTDAYVKTLLQKRTDLLRDLQDRFTR